MNTKKTVDIRCNWKRIYILTDNSKCYNNAEYMYYAKWCFQLGVDDLHALVHEDPNKGSF